MYNQIYFPQYLFCCTDDYLSVVNFLLYCLPAQLAHPEYLLHLPRALVSSLSSVFFFCIALRKGVYNTCSQNLTYAPLLWLFTLILNDRLFSCFISFSFQSMLCCFSFLTAQYEAFLKDLIKDLNSVFQNLCCQPSVSTT